MTMVPHPTFTFTKVIDTNVTHDLTIDKQIQSAALVIGQVADAEANATASGHDALAETHTVTSNDGWNVSALSESTSATNGSLSWLLIG
jgi:hypothetical protein